MTLDLPTLMVMQSFAMACAGAVLLFAWLQNRTISALALRAADYIRDNFDVLSRSARSSIAA